MSTPDLWLTLAKGLGSASIGGLALFGLKRYFTVQDRRDVKLDGCEDELQTARRINDRAEYFIRNFVQDVINVQAGIELDDPGAKLYLKRLSATKIPDFTEEPHHDKPTPHTDSG